MNRRIGWISALIFAIGSPTFIAPPQPASALSYIAPETADQMIQQSDFIVIGDVQDSIGTARTRWVRNQRGEVISAHSTVRVKVRKVFKGNPKTKEIIVGQNVIWAKRRDGTRYVQSIDEIVKPFQKARYLLFLKKGNGVNYYFPMGLVLGKVNLDGKDRFEEASQSTQFQEIRKVVRARFKE